MEEDKLGKKIQKAGLDEPGLAFTDNIMQMIEGQKEINLAPALKSVLENELVADPPHGFSAKVLQGVRTKAERTLAPEIFQRTSLVMFLIGISALLLLIVASFSNAGNVSHDSYFSLFRLNLYGLTTKIITIATASLPYLAPLSTLLLLDYLLGVKLRGVTPKNH